MSTTDATLVEAHRQGRREAMQAYFNLKKLAEHLFDEPDLQEVFMAGYIAELRRLAKKF